MTLTRDQILTATELGASQKLRRDFRAEIGQVIDASKLRFFDVLRHGTLPVKTFDTRGEAADFVRCEQNGLRYTIQPRSEWPHFESDASADLLVLEWMRLQGPEICGPFNRELMKLWDRDMKVQWREGFGPVGGAAYWCYRAGDYARALMLARVGTELVGSGLF